MIMLFRLLDMMTLGAVALITTGFRELSVIIPPLKCEAMPLLPPSAAARTTSVTRARRITVQMEAVLTEPSFRHSSRAPKTKSEPDIAL